MTRVSWISLFIMMLAVFSFERAQAEDSFRIVTTSSLKLTAPDGTALFVNRGTPVVLHDYTDPGPVWGLMGVTTTSHIAVGAGSKLDVNAPTKNNYSGLEVSSYFSPKYSSTAFAHLLYLSKNPEPVLRSEEYLHMVQEPDQISFDEQRLNDDSIGDDADYIPWEDIVANYGTPDHKLVPDNYPAVLKDSRIVKVNVGGKDIWLLSQNICINIIQNNSDGTRGQKERCGWVRGDVLHYAGGAPLNANLNIPADLDESNWVCSAHQPELNVVIKSASDYRKQVMGANDDVRQATTKGEAALFELIGACPLKSSDRNSTKYFTQLGSNNGQGNIYDRVALGTTDTIYKKNKSALPGISEDDFLAIDAVTRVLYKEVGSTECSPYLAPVARVIDNRQNFAFNNPHDPRGRAQMFVGYQTPAATRSQRIKQVVLASNNGTGQFSCINPVWSNDDAGDIRTKTRSLTDLLCPLGGKGFKCPPPDGDDYCPIIDRDWIKAHPQVKRDCTIKGKPAKCAPLTDSPSLISWKKSLKTAADLVLHRDELHAKTEGIDASFYTSHMQRDPAHWDYMDFPPVIPEEDRHPSCMLLWKSKPPPKPKKTGKK